ncbi:M3 family metallopeptidase [Methanoregula sp.]|uniref:M3 family metallopeptidase n=1 Tax=Methanoregula sp. TaxID=2052170 RepID=UPI00237181D9|nr:M3 family metallopeptidase [Methanoregula sp.]MDD1686393.1 Zn-dependent oligopeptidase [Methanoregula sp.]
MNAAKRHGNFCHIACAVLIILAVAASGCMQAATTPPPAGSSLVTPVNATAPIRAHYAPGEITRLATEAQAAANASLEAIAAIPPQQRTTDNTLIAFDTAVSDYYDTISPLIQMGYVYPDPAIMAEGMAVEESSQNFMDEVMTRRNLYNALQNASPRTPGESRLYNVTVRTFKKNGLDLPDDRLSHVRALRADLNKIETRFNANLNNDTTTLEFTQEDLAGVPADTLAAFSRTANGTYLVTMQIPDYTAVMTNADRNLTRLKMYDAYNSRQAETNTKLLEEAVGLRRTIAQELGYATWADYQMDGRMAENPATVMAFVESMKEPLQEKNRAEMAELLKIKQTYDPSATAVDPWEVVYLQNEQKKRSFAYDENEVKEYFPADTVVQGMFATYGTLFGIHFDEVKGADVWSPEVRLFRVSNVSDNATVGYLYLDLYPRENKHQFIYESGIINHRIRNGTVVLPVVVIVDNIAAPTAEKPSLMTPDDASTLFHETGHAMHSMLSDVPYGTLSGTNVEWDFVETPSQTLEEWVYDPQVLESISGHYTNASEKIPATLRDKVIAARNAGNGYDFSRQLVFILFDLRLHTSDGPVNATAIYTDTFAEVNGKSLTAGTHMPATFTHLMGGYDAGYYGYMWSKVYALNIVDEFKKDGMTNQTTGTKFRQDILSKGNTEDGNALLQEFLGHKPGVNALYTFIGINASQAPGAGR